MSLPTRKHPRLKNFDYSQCGCYHITLCTKNRIPLLSQILPPATESARSAIRLKPYGIVTERYIQNIPHVYDGIDVVKYCIMPNHVHLLLTLNTAASSSVPSVVRSLKRMVTKEIGRSIWQESFFDVVICNDTMFQCEWTYIDSNPDKWAEDHLFTPYV